ncbi:putative disease resistance protein RGA3 [Coffea eugenioides]|uniref:putative disease resistance protein RGA3 n=1 Tax=Coffea eugenioides TaxID=49369 RepID=UPI000F6055D1|nr:putative disease resistance protein RGA3 [Coffea eugenioides]
MADKVVDALLGSTVKVLVEKAINVASEQIGQFVGFKKDLEKLKDTLTLIQAVLRDAEEQQVTQELVKRWLENLEATAFDAGNLLDDFNYEMIRRKAEIQNQMNRKVCLFFSLSNPIAFRCKMACKIQKINMDLKRINEEATKLGLLRSQIAPAPKYNNNNAVLISENRETNSAAVGASFVGRDDDVSAIVTELTVTSNSETISVLPIVGLGGIGKTTLAQKVFNNLNIKNHFDKRMWVCVSDIEKHFDASGLFALMLENLEVPISGFAGRDSMEAKVQKLKQILDGEEQNGKRPLKYLLVLDDVWNEDLALWDRFLDSLRGISSAKGSWVLVTMRNKRVATSTAIPSGPWPLKELSDDHCWLILEKKAFGNGEAPDDKKELGLELAKKCQGLPLAASVLGGMLRNKEIDEWRSILYTGLQNRGGHGDDPITRILKLSFDHLPDPALKKCFAYCSIFPQDFQMERNQLIQLWAAEGFLHSDPSKNICMEEVGNRYFTILLESNLFQDVAKDGYGNVLNCKMHDLVHDMVQSISECRTLWLKEPTEADFHGKTFRYLVVERSGGEEIPPFPLNGSFRNITTLVLVENRSIDDGLIIFLACLRVLNIASSDTNELPESIGKLSHLRHLDSSNTSMETLPDSLCKLYNLQTLRLRDCISLTKFPNNFKNLVNLRHFDFFHKDKSSDLTPLEIGQLRSLQTLPFFNIGEERGRQIGELRNIKNLSGKLELRNLELVKSKEEAESANLIGKPNIDELRLLWNEIDNSKNNDSEYNQVLEGLHPHPNLKGLIIERFFGDQLSTWIRELGRLVKFKLQNCKNCKELPTLGNMPSLRSLHLKGLDSVTSIGTFFYGGSGMHSGSGSQRPLKLFPALEHLILEKMPNLREWMEATNCQVSVVVFPVLGTMRIINCPQLATFPNHCPSLKELNIKKTQNGSALMTYICSGVSTLIGLSIESVNGFTKLPSVLFQNNPKLARLELRYCRDLAQFSDFSFDVPQTLEGPNYQSVAEHSCIDNNAPQHLVGLESLEELTVIGCPSLESISIPKGRKYLTALRGLEIFSCRGLTHLSIPQIFESEWDSTSSPFSSSGTCPPFPLPLEELRVSDCLNLISFPIDLTRTPSLSILDISGCEKLTDLPKGKHCSLTSLRYLYIGPFSKTTTELHSFLDLFDALPPPHPYFPSLSDLHLYGWPHWESLPEQLQHLSALRNLVLDGFGVKSLPDWFGKLSSLERLILWGCEKLQNLPSHQSMRSLTRLTDLRIMNCPLLKERCNPESSSSSNDPNSEWSKISHIRTIVIDSEQIRG